MLIKHCLVDLVLKNVGMVCLKMHVEAYVVVCFLVLVIDRATSLKIFGSSVLSLTLKRWLLGGGVLIAVAHVLLLSVCVMCARYF